MGEHNPTNDLAPEGEVIKPEYLQTQQISSHIAKYHKEWLKNKKEEDSFNLSRKMREMLDFMIKQDENVELPEEVFIDADEVVPSNDSALEVFITEN